MRRQKRLPQTGRAIERRAVGQFAGSINGSVIVLVLIAPLANTVKILSAKPMGSISNGKTRIPDWHDAFPWPAASTSYRLFHADRVWAR